MRAIKRFKLSARDHVVFEWHRQWLSTLFYFKMLSGAGSLARAHARTHCESHVWMLFNMLQLSGAHHKSLNTSLECAQWRFYWNVLCSCWFDVFFSFFFFTFSGRAHSFNWAVHTHTDTTPRPGRKNYKLKMMMTMPITPRELHLQSPLYNYWQCETKV